MIDSKFSFIWNRIITQVQTSFCGWNPEPTWKIFHFTKFVHNLLRVLAKGGAKVQQILLTETPSQNQYPVSHAFISGADSTVYNFSLRRQVVDTVGISAWISRNKFWSLREKFKILTEQVSLSISYKLKSFLLWHLKNLLVDRKSVV